MSVLSGEVGRNIQFTHFVLSRGPKGEGTGGYGDSALQYVCNNMRAEARAAWPLQVLSMPCTLEIKSRGEAGETIYGHHNICRDYLERARGKLE